MSTSPGFGDRLAHAVAARESQVVLGLDPDPARIGDGAVAAAAFCARVIGAAGPACVAVKPQLAWFERLGAAGWDALERVATLAAEQGLLVIADAKRGDVEVTSRAYAQALVRAPFDAVTLNPMLGTDAVTPFLEAARATGRGLFVLVRTSNPGAADLQDLRPGRRHALARGAGAPGGGVGRRRRRGERHLGRRGRRRGDRCRSTLRPCGS